MVSGYELLESHCECVIEPLNSTSHGVNTYLLICEYASWSGGLGVYCFELVIWDDSIPEGGGEFGQCMGSLATQKHEEVR